MQKLTAAAATVFRGHDSLIQALALHYHFAAIHPFLDGNGRTARALEALMLQRTGLRDTLFIAMSNYYYYEHKVGYLNALHETGEAGHRISIRLEWPTEITETEFFRQVKAMPKAKVHGFLST